MNKLAIFFFAALAFHAALARPYRSQEQQKHEVQELLRQVRAFSEDAATNLETLQLERGLVRHTLYVQANEFAHDLHDVVHRLNQAIYHHKDQEQGQETLKEVAETLSNTVQSIQRAIRNEPTHLRSQLKSIVETIVEPTQKLSQVAQKQQVSNDSTLELEEVLVDLLVAVHKVQIYTHVIRKPQQEIRSQIQTVTEEVTRTLQKVSSNDVVAVRELVHYAHQFAHYLGEIVHQLQRDVRHHHGEVLSVFEQVLTKLTQIRGLLEKLDEETKLSELKEQLKTNVHSVAAQVERLVQLAQPGHYDEHELRNARTIITFLVIDVLAAERQLQRDLEITTHAQVNHSY